MRRADLWFEFRVVHKHAYLCDIISFEHSPEHTAMAETGLLWSWNLQCAHLPHVFRRNLREWYDVYLGAEARLPNDCRKVYVDTELWSIDVNTVGATLRRYDAVAHVQHFESVLREVTSDFWKQVMIAMTFAHDKFNNYCWNNELGSLQSCQ